MPTQTRKPSRTSPARKPHRKTPHTPHAALTRRELLRRAAVGGLGLAATSILGDALPQQRQPNIVFILADDLGFADVACYGRPDLRTPAIDSIAGRGIRFLQAYANSAVCTASRTALITGRYQYRLRVGLEEPLAGNDNVGLPPEHPTLPSLLKKVGYGTTLVGKWHLGSFPKFGPLKSGYDHFYGFRAGALDYFSHTNDGNREDLWDDDVAIHQQGYLTTMLGTRAVEVIDKYAAARQPFLLSLHFNAPHWPWEGPGDKAESDRLAAQKMGIFDFDGGTQKVYEQMIEAMDHEIGRVLQGLEKNGLAENTIVIFTSDNGGERYADTWPFTGRKTELLEGGLRIPAIISWPAHLAKGKTTDQVSMNMDWLPTLLAAAGGALDPQFPSDGIDLLPGLRDLSRPPVERKIFWRYKANAQHAAREGDYKFLKILDNTFLFNVVEDPMERANLKARHKDIYDRISRDWFEWNQTMLPEVKESVSSSPSGRYTPDRYGAKRSDGTPDLPTHPDD